MSFSVFETMSEFEMRGILAGSGTLVSTPGTNPNPFASSNFSNTSNYIYTDPYSGGSGSSTYSGLDLISALWNNPSLNSDATVFTSYHSDFSASFDSITGGYQISEGMGIQGLFSVYGIANFSHDQNGNLFMIINGGYSNVSQNIMSNAQLIGSVDVYVDGQLIGQKNLQDPSLNGPTLYQTGNIPFSTYFNLGNLCNGQLIELDYHNGYLYNDGTGNYYNAGTLTQLIRVGVGTVPVNQYNVPVNKSGH